MAGGPMLLLPDTAPSLPRKHPTTSADSTHAPTQVDVHGDLLAATTTAPPVEANPTFLYLLSAVSTLGGFLFGYDTGVISGALVLLKEPHVFDLSDLESSSVVSAAVFGAIVGAALSSCGNHVFGRKPVILVSAALFTIGSLLMGFAKSFMVVLVGRLVVGIAIGFSSMVVPLYIAEVSPPQIRGRLVALNTLLVTGGQFFACLLGALLSKVPDGWRYMLGLAAIPAAIQFVGFLLLPESPRFLLSKGRKQDAYAALVQIRGTENVEREYNAIESEIKRQHQLQQQQHKHEDHEYTPMVRDSHNKDDRVSDGASATTTSHQFQIWDEIRKPSVARALLLGCSLQALQQFCGINTVMYYGATIIQLAGFDDPSTAIWLAAVVAFSNFAFTFVGFYLIDRVGRRRLTLGSLVGVVVSLLALGASFYAAQHSSTRVTGGSSSVCASLSSCFDCVANTDCGLCQTPTGPQCLPGDATAAFFDSAGVAATATTCGVTSSGSSSPEWFFSSCPDDSALPGWLILAALFIYLAFFASGMGATPWAINAEIYPLHIRSFALSAATSVNWLANLVVSFTFLLIIDAFNAYGAFWLYAGIATLGFVYLYFELPETKGLALEEIQQMFERRTTYAKIEKE